MNQSVLRKMARGAGRKSGEGSRPFERVTNDKGEIHLVFAKGLLGERDPISSSERRF
jgi:hypothetical protein